MLLRSGVDIPGWGDSEAGGAVVTGGVVGTHWR
jgi:hypothetical protein